MHKNYLPIYLGLMLLTAGIFLTIYVFMGPLPSSLMVHNAHTPFLDWVYTVLTKFGEWVGIAFLVLVFLYKKAYKWLGLSAILLLVMGLLSYLLKIHVYPDAVRPRKLLGNDNLIHMLQWIHVNSEHSFPSGHTLMAVTCATILAFYYKSNPKILLALWILASLAGLSRVYLFQHFFIDVATSICIALFVNGILIYFFRKRIIQ